ncbi:MAG: DUF3341 domain-containing protein [Phycisphaeraceae bacterium]|jgi:hypothetical protein
MTAIDTPHTGHGHADASEASADPKLFGLIGEFDNVDDIIDAANAVREAGYTKIDAHSPFPVHGIDDALGIKPTILPWIVLCMGLTGMTTGLILTTYTMADWLPIPGMAPENFEGYKFLISGKPFNSLAGFIPVIFELTIMFSAYTAVFAMFLLNKLPMMSNPLLRSKRFRRATDDRFFIAIDARDAQFDAKQSAEFVKNLPGCLAVEVIDDE